MDSFGGSSSAAKVVNDEDKKSECSSPVGEPKAKHNVMLEKFQNHVEPLSQPSLSQYTYIPKPFFFYGSLTDPVQLQEVLQLLAPPVLQPATVRPYKIMLWGQFPALVRGLDDSYIGGMVYVVETEQQEKMLKHYETDAYRLKGIRITIKGKYVGGGIFMWAGDPAELTEETWSLEEWKNGVEEEMASHFRPLED